MDTVRFTSSYAEPYPLQVQGESYHRKNIEDVSGYTGEDEGVNADDFIAHLILEDENPYDLGNAVRVDIDGKAVGHLSKPSAKIYRKRLAVLGLSDVVGECYASIKGGFIKRGGEQADFGVRLDLDINTFDVYKPKPPQPKPVVAEIKLQDIESVTPSSNEPPAVKKPVKFGGKMPLIPMNGKGAAYWLLVAPFVLVINLYIILFVGLWYGVKWIVESLSAGTKA